VSAPREGSRNLRRVLACASLLAALAGSRAAADWLAPDASLREAQTVLRYALRDTVGHAGDLALLDSLALAHLHLGHIADARKLFERVIAEKPGDPAAAAGLGKLALWADRNADAESLLVAAGDVEQARSELYFARQRLGQWTDAAAMAEDLQDAGRKPLLEYLANHPAVAVKGERARVLFDKIWPAPLVKVKLNGASVLMMVDTGTPGLLIDKMAATQNKVQLIEGQRLALWTGTRVAVRNALVRKLEIGDVALTDLPASVLSLAKLSLEVNLQSAPIAGVIGMEVLRRFDVTFDFRKRAIELSPPGSAAKLQGIRVPFELWGEDELTVWGSINGGRRLAMTLATGMPGGGFGAPDVVFEEHGLKSGGVSKAMKGAGSWLGGRPWAQVNVPALSIGNVACDKVAGWAGAMEPLEMWRHGVRRDGLLGPGILLKRRVTIDWTKRDLVFDAD
jgi:tetratricopeptide (TPR) repeat protein